MREIEIKTAYNNEHPILGMFAIVRGCISLYHLIANLRIFRLLSVHSVLLILQKLHDLVKEQRFRIIPALESANRQWPQGICHFL